MQQRSTETYNRILSSSYELFSHQGYEATGVALICEKAQISKGAFYHHFPSKKDVLLTLIENWVGNLEKQFASIGNSTSSVPNQLNSMVPALSTIFNQAESIPIFLEFWLQAMRDPEIAHRTIKPYFRFLSLFESLFEQGIKENSIDPSSDPSMSSRLVIAFALGLVMQSMIEPKREDWERISKYSLEKILLGLEKESR
jgi:AcrR family transcriptional regulator